MAKGQITTKGREKLCKGHAGQIQLPKIKYMALGTGGTDSAGDPIPVLGTEEGLRNEVIRKEIEKIEFPIQTTGRYSVTLKKDELAGVSISEQGLLDESGDLILYKTFFPKMKDDDMEFCFLMDEIF